MRAVVVVVAVVTVVGAILVARWSPGGGESVSMALAPAGPRAVAPVAGVSAEDAWHEVAALAGGEVVSVEGAVCGVPVIGSGFIVRGLVVTNAHVAGTASSLVIGGSGQPVRAEVARVSASADLAVAPVGVGEGLVLAGADPVPGDQVLLLARIGGGLRWVDGTVQVVSMPGTYGAEGASLILDAASGPGFSGGPVLDRQGRVVGVLRAVDDATGLAVAEPVSTLSAWLWDGAHVDASPRCQE